MKRKLMALWSDFTLWSLARKREFQDCPYGDDVVFAILLRQKLEKDKTPLNPAEQHARSRGVKLR